MKREKAKYGKEKWIKKANSGIILGFYFFLARDGRKCGRFRFK